MSAPSKTLNGCWHPRAREARLPLSLRSYDADWVIVRPTGWFLLQRPRNR
jgi:hypothetical protein